MFSCIILYYVTNPYVFNAVTKSDVISYIFLFSFIATSHTIDIWRTLIQDKETANQIIENFLELFSENVLSSIPDPHGRNLTLIAAHKPLAVSLRL